MKRWFIPAAARARGQSNDLNREILASNLFNCHKEVINAPPVPSISRCIHIVYRHKNVWEYQWSNFIYNCMSTFLHYVHCKDALLDCSAPGGERCESLTWVDEIEIFSFQKYLWCGQTLNTAQRQAITGKKMLTYRQLDSQERTSVIFELNYNNFLSRKCISRWCLQVSAICADLKMLSKSPPGAYFTNRD